MVNLHEVSNEDSMSIASMHGIPAAVSSSSENTNTAQMVGHTKHAVSRKSSTGTAHGISSSLANIAAAVKEATNFSHEKASDNQYTTVNAAKTPKVSRSNSILSSLSSSSMAKSSVNLPSLGGSMGGGSKMMVPQKTPKMERSTSGILATIKRSASIISLSGKSSKKSTLDEMTKDFMGSKTSLHQIGSLVGMPTPKAIKEDLNSLSSANVDTATVDSSKNRSSRPEEREKSGFSRAKSARGQGQNKNKGTKLTDLSDQPPAANPVPMPAPSTVQPITGPVKVNLSRQSSGSNNYYKHKQSEFVQSELEKETGVLGGVRSNNSSKPPSLVGEQNEATTDNKKPTPARRDSLQRQKQDQESAPPVAFRDRSRSNNSSASNAPSLASSNKSKASKASKVSSRPKVKRTDSLTASWVNRGIGVQPKQISKSQSQKKSKNEVKKSGKESRERSKTTASVGQTFQNTESNNIVSSTLPEPPKRQTTQKVIKKVIKKKILKKKGGPDPTTAYTQPVPNDKKSSKQNNQPAMIDPSQLAPRKKSSDYLADQNQKNQKSSRAVKAEAAKQRMKADQEALQESIALANEVINQNPRTPARSHSTTTKNASEIPNPNVRKPARLPTSSTISSLSSLTTASSTNFTTDQSSDKNRNNLSKNTSIKRSQSVLKTSKPEIIKRTPTKRSQLEHRQAREAREAINGVNDDLDDLIDSLARDTNNNRGLDRTDSSFSTATVLHTSEMSTLKSSKGVTKKNLRDWVVLLRFHYSVFSSVRSQ